MISGSTLAKYGIEQQVWVGCTATALVLFFVQAAGQPVAVPALVAFLSFWNGYRYTKFQGLAQRWANWVLYALSGLGCIALLWYAFDGYSVLKWGIIVGLGLFYNSVRLPIVARRLPFVKAFYVAFLWALFCSWLFLRELNLAYFGMTFCLVSALILPFDIRDSYSDTVRTLPNTVGFVATKWIGTGLLLASAFLALLTFPPLLLTCWVLTLLIAGLGLWRSTPTRTPSYFTIWIEGILALPLLLHLLLINLM